MLTFFFIFMAIFEPMRSAVFSRVIFIPNYPDGKLSRKKTKCLMLKKIQNFYLAENRPSARLWAISGQSLECWTSAHHSYPLIFNQRWFSQHSDIFLQLFFARTKLLYFLLFNTCNKRWYYTIVQCIHCLVCVFVWSWLRREKLKYL